MLGEGKPPAVLSDSTGFLMNWCATRARAAFASALADVGLRPPQYAVMAMIDADPGLTQQALVEGTGVDPSTMVQLLDGLQEAGLAERRPHASDRRKRAVHLTADGTRRLALARAAGAKVGEQAFAPLTAAERVQLHALLRKLAGLD